MKTSGKIYTLVILLALCVTAGGCGDNAPESFSDAAEASGNMTQDAGEKEYGSIGSVDGIQYDEKYGNLISPYTRCSIAPESASYLWLDDTGDQVKDDMSYSSVFGGAEACATIEGKTGKLDTFYTALDDGSMELRQSLKIAEGGVSGVSWIISVPMRYSVIIPAWDGICLDEEHPEIYDKRTYLSYPREWQAQMLLIQGERGGILIRAEDDGTQFKGLNITNDGENFFLEIRTVPQAPFTDYTGFETVAWKIIPYKGTWQSGADIYRQYMDEAFDLSGINEREPGWASGIQLVWMDDLDSRDKLRILADEVDPSRTLIQIPGWRAAAYDTKYPDYTPKAGIVDLIKYAQSLGFKVSLHCNMLGCAFDSEEWENGIKDAACLDAYTLKTIVEGYTANGVDYRFGQINQASEKWQDLMVDIYTEVIRVTGADCIHLDQSLICFNDGRGYVNGMTTMQGNVEFQRKLAEALPGVAFSGEGINEYNMRYADFLQQHVYGLDSNAKSWSNTYFEQIVPLVTYLFDDYARQYHYPALPTADEENRDYYLAWYRAGNAMSGHIPCLYRESVVSLTEPSEVFTMVLDDARFRISRRPVINRGEWGEDAVMSWILSDGTVSEWKLTDEDLSFYPDTEDPDPTTVFVQGVESYRTQRELKGWILYDENRLKGLRTGNSYMLSAGQRDNEAAHILELEDNLTTSAFLTENGYTAIALEEIIPSNKRIEDFTHYDGEIRAGEVLHDGTENSAAPFSSVNSFWFTFPDQGQVRHMGDRIMFHPPWHDEVESIGYTWMETDVPLEVVGNASFEASFQLATAESAAGSDGVIFKVYAWEKGDESRTGMVSEEVNCKNEIGIPVSLDLTAFEGRTVTIRVECHTGPTPRNDSCHMVSPQVVQNMGNVTRLVSYTLKTRSQIQGIVSYTGEAKYEKISDDQYVITSDIGDIVFLLHGAGPISGTVELNRTPYVAVLKMDSGETVSPYGSLIPMKMVAESNYELRYGLFQHPPQSGVSRVTYLLVLPQRDSLYFSGAAAMRRGSANSDGVTFSVLVNGKELASLRKPGAGGFEEMRVDLGEYAGQTVLLTLQTDSGATSAYDYAFWGDPRVYIE